MAMTRLWNITVATTGVLNVEAVAATRLFKIAEAAMIVVYGPYDCDQ